jgi:IS1 family transposase
MLCRSGVPFRRCGGGQERTPIVLLFLRHNTSYLGMEVRRFFLRVAPEHDEGTIEIHRCDGEHRMQKKAPALQPGPHVLGALVHPAQSEVARWRADEREVQRGWSAERDAMGRVGARQTPPRWLWPARAPHTGQVWAEVLGRRQATVFMKRQALCEPLGLTRSSTEGGGAYACPLEAENHTVGKAKTQTSESQPIHVRTRSQR